MPVYELAKNKGIPADTCNPVIPSVFHFQYLAINNAYSGDKAECFTCSPDGSCAAINPHFLLTVSDMGVVSGNDNIKAEIYKNGPIACAMCVTADFETYSGGIYSGAPSSPSCLNHEISVIGYGTNGTTDYWIVRNSIFILFIFLGWGDNWGEDGYFRINMADGQNLNMCAQNSGIWATGVTLKRQ